MFDVRFHVRLHVKHGGEEKCEEVKNYDAFSKVVGRRNERARMSFVKQEGHHV